MKRANATVAVGAVLLLGVACGLQTSQISGGTAVNQGAGTVESARRFLDGKWTLSGLQVSTPEGKRAAIDATGTLISDSFGNLEITYRLSDAGLKVMESLGIKVPDPVLMTSGQVAIDLAQKRITYVSPDAAAKAFDPETAARRANPFALERPRYYSLAEDGSLTLATRYDDGKEAAVGTWKKVE